MITVKNPHKNNINHDMVSVPHQSTDNVLYSMVYIPYVVCDVHSIFTQIIICVVIIWIYNKVFHHT